MLTWQGNGGVNSGEKQASPAQISRFRRVLDPNFYSLVDLGDSTRLALMLTPKGRGNFREQAGEVFALATSVLKRQPQPMVITFQTIFLRDTHDQAECERVLATHFGPNLPVTNFVLQPPCSGAALAMEAWAIGGDAVRVERFGPNTLAVSYDSVRWVYCAGLQPGPATAGVYAQTQEALARMRADLTRAGSGFEHVVRTWFYLGGITEGEGANQRYRELNRARSDVYRHIEFCRFLRGNATAPLNGPHAGDLPTQSMARRSHGRRKSGKSSELLAGNSHLRRAVEERALPAHLYPASTGIGMAGAGLVTSCLTLQTQREDAFVVALENPQQTPAYDYGPQHSPQSPKFSRAMALVLGRYATTWVSGTASIVNSESRHPSDITRQTEQTIDNIERLIVPENFTAHGVRGAGAELRDFAKIRVYLKRAEDFALCRAVCERRFGSVPAIYAVADVCRPELLVEIEGIAFSKYSGASLKIDRSRAG
jgi:enamine deaminase RidA (YjgF/YER057c/UK114 family)